MNNDLTLAEMIGSLILQHLRSLKLIDELELRDFQIRNDYKALRLINSSPVCVQLLMEKYSLSDSAINTILFRKKDPKSKIPIV